MISNPRKKNFSSNDRSNAFPGHCTYFPRSFGERKARVECIKNRTNEGSIGGSFSTVLDRSPILLARYFFMYRPSSKLSGKPRIVRRSVASTPSLPPRVSAQVRGCCIGAPSSPLAQLGKEGTKRKGRTFSPVYSSCSARTIEKKTRNLEFRIIQLGIKRVSETNRDPKNSRYERPTREEKRKEERRRGKLRRKEVEESFAEGSKNCRQFPGAETLNAISRRPVGCTRETPRLDQCVRVYVCMHGRRVYV